MKIFFTVMFFSCIGIFQQKVLKYRTVEVETRIMKNGKWESWLPLFSKPSRGHLVFLDLEKMKIDVYGKETTTYYIQKYVGEKTMTDGNKLFKVKLVDGANSKCDGFLVNFKKMQKIGGYDYYTTFFVTYGDFEVLYYLNSTD